MQVVPLPIDVFVPFSQLWKSIGLTNIQQSHMTQNEIKALELLALHDDFDRLIMAYKVSEIHLFIFDAIFVQELKTGNDLIAAYFDICRDQQFVAAADR